MHRPPPPPRFLYLRQRSHPECETPPHLYIYPPDRLQRAATNPPLAPVISSFRSAGLSGERLYGDGEFFWMFLRGPVAFSHFGLPSPRLRSGVRRGRERRGAGARQQNRMQTVPGPSGTFGLLSVRLRAQNVRFISCRLKDAIREVCQQNGCRSFFFLRK